MAKKIAVVNMKGGVGKTTLAVNLACFYAYQFPRPMKVLLVDLDPQFNASQYVLGQHRYKAILDENKPTIWHIFEQNTRTPAGKVGPVLATDVVHRISGSGEKVLDLIPSRLELALSLKNPGQKERFLAKTLRPLNDGYDIILIDCAPTESVLTTAAYLAADHLLVPVRPEYLSTIGLQLLVQSMQDFKEEYSDHDLSLAGVVFNANSEYVPEEARAKQEVLALATAHKWHVFDNSIKYSRSYPKGAREGRAIQHTSYARSTTWQPFFDFAYEFSRRIGLSW
ncbi:MAG TPA: ParA family protein [Planctomycetota bacterium]|jgi:chromosome partitioning protein